MKVLALIGIGVVFCGVAIYIYLSPSTAFRDIQAAVRANDVDTFSSEIDSDSVLKHLRNQMSLQMQNALRSYSTRPDAAATESRLAPYFNSRSEALATPASLLRELASQLKGTVGAVKVEFRNLSVAQVDWSANGEQHEVLLTRQGLVWKLAAVDFLDAMPRFLDQPTSLVGTYHRREFENCCFEGKASTVPYNQLQLSAAMDVLDVFPDEDSVGNMFNVTEVQISGDEKMFAGLKDEDLIEVHCVSLSLGNTGHYALPVYCDADSKSLR